MKFLNLFLLLGAAIAVFGLAGCNDETIPPKKLVDDMNKQRMMQGSGNNQASSAGTAGAQSTAGR